MPHPDNDHLKALFKRSKEQNAELAKTLLKEREHTGKLVTNVRSKALISVWIGGIIILGFIIFTLANTIGKSLLGLEESLEHHQSYETEDSFR